MLLKKAFQILESNLEKKEGNSNQEYYCTVTWSHVVACSRLQYFKITGKQVKQKISQLQVGNDPEVFV